MKVVTDCIAEPRAEISERAPRIEVDCGIFTYSMDEVSTYYADSTMYDGVSYRVFEVDEDSLVWGDEGVYYMME